MSSKVDSTTLGLFQEPSSGIASRVFPNCPTDKLTSLHDNYKPNKARYKNERYSYIPSRVHSSPCFLCSDFTEGLCELYSKPYLSAPNLIAWKMLISHQIDISPVHYQWWQEEWPPWDTSWFFRDLVWIGNRAQGPFFYISPHKEISDIFTENHSPQATQALNTFPIPEYKSWIIPDG